MFLYEKEFKILLCVFTSSMLITNTVMAKEYTETITDDTTLNNSDTITVNNPNDIGIDSTDKSLNITVNGEVSINAIQNALNNINGMIGINVKMVVL